MRRYYLFFVLLILVLNSVYAQEKVIYGSDDRYEVAEYHDASFVEMAQSTAVMMEKWDLNEASENSYKLAYNPLRYQRGFCAETPFLDQNSIALCTGFLIAPDILVTAGHCVNESSSCDRHRWVFGYTQQDVDGEEIILKRDVFSCTVIESVLDTDTGLDYAVLRLDREANHRTPLKVRSGGKVEVDEPLLVIGSPVGIPLKISDGARVRGNDQEIYFTANLDTFGGNSGSPVINQNSGLVEGLLVRGEEDFEYERQRGCYINKQCDDDKCSGESVTRIGMIKNIDHYISVK